jgi:hypothetical protein
MVYYAINLPLSIKDDGMGCRKRLQRFTQVFKTSLGSFLAARKKREIE